MFLSLHVSELSLSPFPVAAMQKAIRVSETQVLKLATKAKQEKLMSREGYLWKRSSDTGKWQQRYFALYQNMLFYYESEKMDKPSGLALVEGCYCEKIVTVQKGRDKDVAQQTGVSLGKGHVLKTPTLLLASLPAL